MTKDERSGHNKLTRQAMKNRNWQEYKRLVKESLRREDFKGNATKANQDLKRSYREVREAFENTGRHFKTAADQMKYLTDDHVKCRYCKSKNTSLKQGDLKFNRTGKKVFAGVIFLPLAFIVGRRRHTHGECFECGKKWAID